MRVGEMHTHNYITQMVQMMWGSGKSTLATGASAVVALLHATQRLIYNAQLRCSNGEVTPGNSGQLAMPADAAARHD